MNKKTLGNSTMILLLILIIIGSILLVIGSIFGLSFLLYKLMDANDSYLTTGLAFCILCGIGVIVLPSLMIFLITKKKQRISAIKRWIKKYKIPFIVLITVVLATETILGFRSYDYYRDLKIGIQDANMMDAVIEVRRTRHSKNTYIVGYIDGKNEVLKLIDATNNDLHDNNRYKLVRVKYYKYIKDVVDLDIYVSYKDNK